MLVRRLLAFEGAPVEEAAQFGVVFPGVSHIAEGTTVNIGFGNQLEFGWSKPEPLHNLTDISDGDGLAVLVAQGLCHFWHHLVALEDHWNDTVSPLDQLPNSLVDQTGWDVIEALVEGDNTPAHCCAHFGPRRKDFQHCPSANCCGGHEH